MDPETALGTGFDRWLESVVGADEPHHRVSPARPLTPYGTSMRVTKAIARRLQLIEADLPLGGARPGQPVTDMRAIGLLETDGPLRLSALGKAVLTEWRRLGVANEKNEHEVVRAAVLCRQGVLAGNPLYTDHLSFWVELRLLRRPVDWFADPGALVLATYLDGTVDGYNPFRVLVALEAAFAPLASWSAWADREAPPPGWSRSRLRHLIDRVEGFSTRPKGIRTYCQAMEAVYLAAADPATLPHVAGALTT